MVVSFPVEPLKKYTHEKLKMYASAHFTTLTSPIQPNFMKFGLRGQVTNVIT